MKTTRTIKDLLEQFEDEAAFRELVSRREEALPALRRAFGKLDAFDTITARWYVRVLESLSAQPVPDITGILGKVFYKISIELGWALHRAAKPRDCPYLRKELARAIAYKPGRERILPRSFGDADIMPRAVFISEVLGRFGDREAFEVINHLYEASVSELDRLRKEGSDSYEMFYRDFAPAAAASAAALLSISLQGGMDNEKDRRRWRRSCVAIARDKAINYGFSGISPPMSFLFTGSPSESTRVLVQLLREGHDRDQTLRYLAAWLKEGRQNGIKCAFDSSVRGASEMIEALSRLTDFPIEWIPTEDPPRGAALQVLQALAPEGAVLKAMQVLREGPIGTDAMEDAIDTIRRSRTFREIAAIVVEGAFSNRVNPDCFATIRESNEQKLGSLLVKEGFSPLEGWKWDAPEGTPGDPGTPEGLHGNLCEAARIFTRAQIERDKGWSALSQKLFTHSLGRLCLYRNLLHAIARADKTGMKALIAMLPPLESEYESAMIAALLEMAKWILRGRAGFLYPLLLASPAVTASVSLVLRIVREIRNNPVPEAAGPLNKFKCRLQQEKKSGREVSFELTQLLDEAILNLGSVDAISDLLKKMGTGGYVSSEEKLTLLRLAARSPGIVDEMTYERVLSGIISDGYSTYSGWNEAIMCPALHAFMVKRLEDKETSHELMRNMAEFIFWSSRCALPPQAIPLILARLGPSIESALRNPGEEWEDRNWGGYNQTPQEDLAEWLSQALLTLLKCRYDAEGWRVLLTGVLGISHIDLSRVTIAQSSSSSFHYKEVDLFSMLKDGLKKLDIAAVNGALAHGAPAEILQNALKILSS